LVFDGSLPLGFDSTLPRVGTESLRADRSDELALAFPEVPDDVPGFRDGKLIVAHGDLYKAGSGSTFEERIVYMDTHTVFKIPLGRRIGNDFFDPFEPEHGREDHRWFTLAISSRGASSARVRIYLVCERRTSEILNDVLPRLSAESAVAFAGVCPNLKSKVPKST
jgi:hypothetical protein